MRAFVVLLLVAVVPGIARADIIGPNPIPIRLATAPVTLLGTVTTIEDKPVLATRYVGDQMKVPFRVAVVKIDKGLLGTKEATHLRVGFVEMQNPRRPIQTLAKDQQVLMFLTPHPQESFHVSAEYFYGFVYSSEPNFKAQVEEAAKAAQALADPMPVLQGQDRAARYAAASLLIHRYHAPRGANPKREPIDAAESKAILTALAEADWGQQQAAVYPYSALQTFSRLGLTAADGWTPPAEFKQVPTAAKKWLTENAATYRIRRTVAADK